MEQWSSNLAPVMYITKETKWHLLYCWHDNTLAPASFCEKPNIPVCNLFEWDRGSSQNRHGSHIVLTLPIRLLRVGDPCVRWNLGISCQRHDCCHFVSFVMFISHAKFEDHCFNISGDILNSVFYRFSETIYDVITSLICLTHKRKYL